MDLHAKCLPLDDPRARLCAGQSAPCDSGETHADGLDEVRLVNAFLDALGRFCARRNWIVLGAWLAILVVLAVVRNAAGGDFVNDYTVTGSQSADGLNVLSKTFPQQGGYAGQIVFHAKSGTLSSDTDVVNQS